MARSTSIARCVALLLAILASDRTARVAAAANLTLTVGGRVSVELLFSDAQFHNTLSVVSPGVTTTSGCALEPATGLTGVPVLSEKVSQRGCRVELDSDAGTAGIQPFAAGTTFTFGFCAQTDADAACEFVWSSNSALNSDGFDHVQTTAIHPADFPGQIFQLAWEDKENGGDQDFNDLVALVRVDVDSDGDGLWDDWETFGLDTDGDGTVDFDLPALGADPAHKDIFLEIDSMDCAVAGGDCAAGDTHSHAPKAAAIAAMVQAFAAAPVANPDGNPGVNLHVDVSNTIPHQNFLDIPGPCGGSPLPAGIGDFDTVKADPANFGPLNPRRFVYHYQLHVHRRGPASSSSGCSELPGNDTVVSLGEWNAICILPGNNGVLNTVAAGDDVTILGTTNLIFAGPNLVCNTAAAGDDVQFVAVGVSPPADPDGDGLDDRTVGTVMQQAGTSMHELGHNLQLCHGGQLDAPGFTQCNTNFKPNYLSIMNYAFQMRGIPPTDPDGGGPLTGRLDYSPADLPDLVEANAPCPAMCGLSEPAGIGDGTDSTLFVCPSGAQNLGAGTGAINWNCDTDSTDTSLAADINGDGVQTVLAGFDDWDNIKYDFQNTTAFEDGAHIVVTQPIEMDFPTFLELPQIVGISIKFGSVRIPIRLSSKGVVPVAILTQGTFDATTVDPLRVCFGSAGSPATRDCTEAHGRGHIQDVDSDGDLDLVLHFETRETGIQPGDTQACLAAATFGGAQIAGCDGVTPLP
jgi:hypothetical protein